MIPAVRNSASKMHTPAHNHNAKTTLIDDKGRIIRANVAYTSGVTSTLVKPRVIMRVTLLIDASGSMTEKVDGNGQDTRMDLVLSQVMTVLHSVLNAHDQVTLAFFNKSYHQVWVDKRVGELRSDEPRMREEARLMLYGDANGGTKLWDKTHTALESMKKRSQGDTDKDGNAVMNLLLVFTDGYDNASSSSMDEVIKAIARPRLCNFHFLPIIADAPTMAQRLHTGLENVKHAHVVAVQNASGNSIRRAFEGARKMVSKVKNELLETLVLQLRSSADGKAKMHTVLHAVAAGANAGRGMSILNGMGGGNMLCQPSSNQARGRSQSCSRGPSTQQDQNHAQSRCQSRQRNQSDQTRGRSQSRRRGPSTQQNQNQNQAQSSQSCKGNQGARSQSRSRNRGR